MTNHTSNIVRIKAVYNALGSLRSEVVFVGGATVSLYADRMAEEARATNDVDVLVELWAHKDYAVIEEQLRKMGFVNDVESKIVCRYKIQGIIVDIMPTGGHVLGVTNIWYAEGFRNAVEYKIDDHHTIKIFSAPYFLASKIEAFKSPGREYNNDGLSSPDFEDIVFVLENRFSIWEELANAPTTVKMYLKKEFSQLISNPLFESWIHSLASFGSPPMSYIIIDRLEKFVQQ